MASYFDTLLSFRQTRKSHASEYRKQNFDILNTEMAIIPTIPGLEVTIRVSDEPVPEYEIPPNSARLVRLDHPWLQRTVPGYPGAQVHKPSPHGYSAKFIAVESGTHPSVEFFKSKDYCGEGNHIAYSVKFDDLELKIRHEPPGLSNEEWEDATSAVVIGDEETQTSEAFCFADLKCINDADTKRENGDIEFLRTSNVGRIRISVYHMLGHREDKVAGYQQASILTPDAMREDHMKAKKISNRLQFTPGDAIQNPEAEYIDDFYDGIEVSFAVYDFYYRNRDALIALGVLPRESSEDIEDGKDDMCDTKAEFDSDESDSEGCLSKEQLLLKLRNLKQLNRGMKRKLQQRQREGRAMKYESESLERRVRKGMIIKQEEDEVIVIED